MHVVQNVNAAITLSFTSTIILFRMPPKKGGNVNKKTEVKKKEKIIEDKTFGLKNKKGGKAQKVSLRLL